MPRALLAVSALLALAPVAAAFSPELAGQIDVRSVIVILPPCEETGVLALLDVETRVIPEEADFTLRTDTDCGAPLLRFEGRLESWGWRLGDGEVTRGTLAFPDPAGKSAFHLETTGCPATAHCQLGIARMTFDGDLAPVVTTTGR